MFITGQQDVLLPVIDESLECICNLISLVAMNPSNPIFNHSLFECAATLVKFCGGTAAGAAKINTKFVPVLQGILQNDVADFIHYVFQLLAILVEVCNESALPIVVQPLVAPTLLPALWSSSENIPALTRFLQACIVKDPNFFVMSGMLPQLLGIFQTLISSKVHDIHAFALLDALVQSVAATHLESYMSGIMMVILKRLQVNKSPRLALNFLLFLCVFLVAATSFPQPPSYLIRLLDGMQPKLLALVLSTQLLPHAPKIRDRHDRKLAILGLTKLATECPELLAGDADYAVLFGNLVGTIVVMLTTLPAGGLGDIQSEEVSEEEPAGTFWKLRVAPAPRRCPSIESVVDPTVIFVNSLVTMARTRSPGSVAASLGGMDDASKNALQMLLQQANVSL
jgi:exportin-2 (importin alpha re-exporter)